jgi:hypothetical protein
MDLAVQLHGLNIVPVVGKYKENKRKFKNSNPEFPQ